MRRFKNGGIWTFTTVCLRLHFIFAYNVNVPGFGWILEVAHEHIAAICCNLPDPVHWILQYGLEVFSNSIEHSTRHNRDTALT